MSDKVPQTAEEIQDFIDAVDKAPNVQKFFISEDQSAAIVQATFIEHSLDYGETFHYIQDMVAAEKDDAHDIYVAGQPVLTGWVYE